MNMKSKIKNSYAIIFILYNGDSVIYFWTSKAMNSAFGEKFYIFYVSNDIEPSFYRI